MKKGISLIVLIITIIVMIILAGVIILTLNSSQILSKSEFAKGQYNESVIKENIQTIIQSALVDGESVDSLRVRNELEKAFGKSNVTYTDNDYMIDINGKLYSVNNKGEISTSLEIAKSTDGILENSINGILSNYTIYGNSIQRSTPTPNSPVEIESLGQNGSIELINRGKNLFYINDFKDARGVTVSKNDNQTLTLNGTLNMKSNIILSRIKIPSEYVGKKISAKLEVLSGKINIVEDTTSSLCAFSIFNQDNSKYIRNIVSKKGEITTLSFTNVLPETTNEMYDVMFQCWSVGSTFENAVVRVQIECGEKTTEYEPYREQITTTIDLTGHEPLRKVGNYADYIDYKTGKINRCIKKLVLNGNETTYNTYEYKNLEGVYWGRILGENKMREKGLCTHENQIGEYYYDKADSHYMWLGVKNPYIYWVGILDYFGFTTINEFKNWLKSEYAEGNPVEIYYYVKDIKTEDIELPTIKTVDGTNIITINSNNQPSKIELEYYKSK